jgi:hypothetical protein
LRSYDAEASYADRTTMIQKLATELMNEFPNYKKSVFKHVATKVTLNNKKKTKEEIMESQRQRLINSKKAIQEKDEENEET